MTYLEGGWLGLSVVIAAYVAAIAFVLATRLSTPFKSVLVLGILLRPIGALARLIVLQEVYRGSGDANVYFGKARSGATLIWEGYVSDFLAVFFASDAPWYGTRFMEFATTIVVSAIGETRPGVFMAFAALPLMGLLAFGVAFSRACPGGSLTRYLFWILLFPSLLYWPSSIGKESVIVLGLGLAVLGFVGKAGRIHWLPLIFGIFLVFAIRPEVAGVIVVSFILAQWLSFDGRWTVRRTMQAVVIAVGGIAALLFFLRASGLEQLDLAEVTDYVESSNARDVGGDSAIEPVEVGPLGVPMALVNILFRPFPWESGSATMFLSAAEIWLFWLIVLIRRHNFVRALRHWRGDRLLRTAIPFILIYSIALGMMMSNLGIIARQRIFLFPFLFVLLEARPREASAMKDAAGPAAPRDGLVLGQRS
jgi:hypothetical protein